MIIQIYFYSSKIDGYCLNISSIKGNTRCILSVAIILCLLHDFYFLWSYTSVYSFYGGCKWDILSNGVNCDGDSTGASCGTEVCQSCSFNECQQHAIASNSFAFSYRGTGTKWCKLCTRTEVSTQGTAHAQDWGIYVKGIS